MKRLYSSTLSNDTRYTNNDLQRQDARYFFKEYLKFFNFSNNETILDMGTGDGAILQNVILPKMPSGLKHIVALDTKKDMLQLAKMRLLYVSNIEFVCLPIESSALPARFPKKFNHIFSFYCLHFVTRPFIQYVFGNLLAMLKPGGEMFMTMVADHPCFAVHKELAKMDPWKTFMDDDSDFITPYQYSLDPHEEIGRVLKIVGFVDYKCDLVERTYTHRNQRDFWAWTVGVNPFIKRIPQDLLSRYRNDYFEAMSKLDKFAIRYDPLGTPQEITASYRIVVICAIAPHITKNIIIDTTSHEKIVEPGKIG